MEKMATGFKADKKYFQQKVSFKNDFRPCDPKLFFSRNDPMIRDLGTLFNHFQNSSVSKILL